MPFVSTAGPTRRSVLASGIALGAASLAAPAFAKSKRRFFGPGGEVLGLQIYTLGNDMLKDLDAAFGAVAAIGYRAVELLMLDQPPAEVRDALRRACLTARSTQTSFETDKGPNLTTGFDALVATAHAIGLEWVVPSLFDVPKRLGPPHAGEDLGAWFVRLAAEMTADDWKRYADTLNRTGARLKPHGLRIAHHNHNLDFHPVGDTNGFELMIADTDPDLVAFELDVGWVAAAGHDPIDILARHKGRFRMMHMKDIKPETVPNYAFKQVPAVPGQGVLDWTRLLPIAKAAGVTGWYVEEEAPFPTTRLDAVRANYAYLSRLKV